MAAGVRLMQQTQHIAHMEFHSLFLFFALALVFICFHLYFPFAVCLLIFILLFKNVLQIDYLQFICSSSERL